MTTSAHESIFLRAALTYAARGWAVFPLGPHSKKPPAGSNGVLDATTNEAQIRAWWQETPHANIGIATGKSGLVVIDVDGQIGEQSLIRWRQDNGELPATVTAHTPSGGTHLLYSYDGTEIAPGVDVLGKGSKVDLRAANSYIVAPPSLHPDFPTGPAAVYKWDKDAHPARHALAELPAALFSLLVNRPQPGRFNDSLEPDMIEDGQDAYGARQAAVLARKGFSKEEARAALGAMIDTRFAGGWAGLDARRPWKAGDVERWIKGAYEKFYDPEGSDAQTDEAEAVLSLVGTAQAASATAQPLQGAMTPRASNQPVAGAVDDEAIDKEYADFFEDGDAWARRASDKVPVIIPGILHSKAFAMIVADPKTGKTWLAFDLLLSVASGKPFVGRYEVDTAAVGPVAYMATEGVHEDSRDRLFALAQGKGLDPWEVSKALKIRWRKPFKLDDPKLVNWLTRQAVRYPLMVVDVLGESWSGDENASQDVLKFLDTIKPITNAGATILLIHHTNKTAEATGAKRIRGSTAWYGAMDDLIELERNKEGRTTATVITRAGAPEKPFSFTWPTDQVTADQSVTLDWQPLHDKEQEATKARAAILEAIRQEPGRSETGLRGKGGVSHSRLKGVLSGLVAEGLIFEKQYPAERADGVMRLMSGYFISDPEIGPETA